MPRARVPIGVLVLLLFLAVTARVAGGATADVPRITTEEAKALLGAPKVVFVDARVSKAWGSSDQKIPGALQPDKWDLESWAGTYDRDTTFIVY